MPFETCLKRPHVGLAFATLLLLTAPVAGAAQTADVAGKWNLTVTTDQGTTNPTFTLEQDGETLMGRYSSEALGEADLTGTVNGASVRISLEGSIQGQPVPVVYSGTLNDDGTMSGTIDVAGGALTGTFTATREDGA